RAATTSRASRSISNACWARSSSNSTQRRRHERSPGPPDTSRPPDAAPGGGTCSWSQFIRLELMEPIDALAGLGVLLAQDAAGAGPGESPGAAKNRLRPADRPAKRARDLLPLGDEAPSAELEQTLSRARHERGNRLNQLAGMVQLLQIAEAAHFG